MSFGRSSHVRGALYARVLLGFWTPVFQAIYWPETDYGSLYPPYISFPL